DPRVGALLGMDRHELLGELRLLLPDGRLAGGASAVLAVADLIWWVKPLTWLSYLPGVMAVLDFGYRWVAAHRSCTSLGNACETSRLTVTRVLKFHRECPGFRALVRNSARTSGLRPWNKSVSSRRCELDDPFPGHGPLEKVDRSHISLRPLHLQVQPDSH